MERFNVVWMVLIVIVVFFTLLYLYFSLFPGEINGKSLQYFTRDYMEQARQYARSVRMLFITAFIVKAAFLSWFLFSGTAMELSRATVRIAQNRYYLGVLIFILCFWLIMQLISLPFQYYGNFVLQHKWDFSTQSMLSWWIDFFKSSALSLMLTIVGVLMFFLIIQHCQRTWWVITAVLFTIWLVVQSYLWPVVVAPLFNDFQPVSRPEIVQMTCNLADKADLSVEKILEMDASKRTSKANAYFAGIGSSKRIVLYDNLLKNYSPEEIEAVIAHEMAHWKKGHILKGMSLGALGIFALWGLIYLLFNNSFKNISYPPAFWAYILYFTLLISFITMPLQNHISRNMEREADTLAVRLTMDKKSAINLQKHLAFNNLSDIAPPAFLEWFSYSHPSTLKRILYIKNLKIDKSHLFGTQTKT